MSSSELLSTAMMDRPGQPCEITALSHLPSPPWPGVPAEALVTPVLEATWQRVSSCRHQALGRESRARVCCWLDKRSMAGPVSPEGMWPHGD